MPDDEATNSVERIEVRNQGAYVANFSVRYFDLKSGSFKVTEWNSGNFPVSQSRATPPLTEIGVPDNSPVIMPHLHAILGHSADGSPAVQYGDDQDTAIYKATGTTLNVNVDFVRVS